MNQVAATDEQQWRLMSSRRSAIYGLLSVLFRSEPDTDVVRWIRQPRVFTSLRGAGMEFDEIELFGSPVDTVAAVLAIDYAGLFQISPGCVALNESSYRGEDGQFWGNPATELSMIMESIGVATGEDWDVASDHVSVELELMKTLIDRERGCLEAGDMDGAGNYRVLQMELLGSHILHWVPAMCDRVVHQAGTSFFRGLAAHTRDFVLQDVSYLL